jgi:hypothetical protein
MILCFFLLSYSLHAHLPNSSVLCGFECGSITWESVVTAWRRWSSSQQWLRFAKDKAIMLIEVSKATTNLGLRARSHNSRYDMQEEG